MVVYEIELVLLAMRYSISSKKRTRILNKAAKLLGYKNFNDYFRDIKSKIKFASNKVYFGKDDN